MRRGSWLVPHTLIRAIRQITAKPMICIASPPPMSMGALGDSMSGSK